MHDVNDSDTMPYDWSTDGSDADAIDEITQILDYQLVFNRRALDCVKVQQETIRLLGDEIDRVKSWALAAWFLAALGGGSAIVQWILR